MSESVPPPLIKSSWHRPCIYHCVYVDTCWIGTVVFNNEIVFWTLALQNVAFVKYVVPTTPFLIANRHLFTSDRQIALVSSAGIPLRQRSPHIDIVHLYKARGIENRHSAPCWHWSQNLGYWMSMPKLNAPAEIRWRRSNMNTRDPILMKSVEVLKDCRSLNAAAEMNCPMPRSVEKVPIRNEKRCIRS